MALTAAKNITVRKGEYGLRGVKGTVTVYTGAWLADNAGYVTPSTGLITQPFAGVARTGTIAASTTDGAREIEVIRTGLVQSALSGATVADIDKLVYASDDATLTLIPTGPPVGKVAELVSSGVVMVDITGYVNEPTTGPLHIKIPFSQNATETDTGYDLPARMLVEHVYPEVVTNVAGSTIDVGVLSTESGGDADGFVDGASCATAGVVAPNIVDATAANITLGALLYDAQIKSADATALYLASRRPHYAGSITGKSISYMTSAHAIAGYIHVIGRVI